MNNKEVAEVYSALKFLSQMNLPCSFALAKNLKKVEKSSTKYFDLLNEIRDKYCTLTKDGYKVIPEAKEKDVNTLSYEDFDAGKKQEEYNAKLKEASNAESKIEFYPIEMDREIIINDKTMKLGEKIEQYDIPAALMTPLVDVIFI